MLLLFLLFLQVLLTQSSTLALIGGNISISVYAVDMDEGNLQLRSSVSLFSPSPWISVFPPTNPFLVLATGNNTIILYGLNSQRAELTKYSEVDSGGINPAYVTFDLKGEYALVANYGFNDSISNGSGSAVIPIVRGSDGSYTLKPATAVVTHDGSSVNPDRQAGSHTHSIYLDPSGNYAFACDLGLDKIWQYSFPGNGSLPANPNGPYSSPSQLGEGPRHLAWHPNGVNVYLITEMGNTIDTYEYDAPTGTLTGPFASVSTVPADFTGASYGAEIAITPNGRFLYASNRGYDSIAAYHLDVTNTDFPFKLIGYYTQNVVWPRNFAIDPSGQFLFVGSSNANEVVTFSIDQTTGVLTPTGAVSSFPLPETIQIFTVPDFKSEWGIFRTTVAIAVVGSIISAFFLLSNLLRLR